MDVMNVSELPDHFLTLAQAARLADVSRRTVQYHMGAGDGLNWTKVGREVLFSRADVLAWKAKHYPEGKPRPGRRRP